MTIKMITKSEEKAREEFQTQLTRELDDIAKHDNYQRLKQLFDNYSSSVKNPTTKSYEEALGRDGLLADPHTIRDFINQNALKCMQFLADHQFNFDIMNDCGETTFHYACENNGSKEMVHLLIEPGTNINRKSGIDWTPLMSTVISKRSEAKKIEIINELMTHGANPTVKGFF